MSLLVDVASLWRNKRHAKGAESLPARGNCPSCGQPPVYWVVKTKVGWCANKDCAVLTFGAAGLGLPGTSPQPQVDRSNR